MVSYSPGAGMAHIPSLAKIWMPRGKWLAEETKITGCGGSGTGTAELGLLYAYEGIVLILGIVFIRYFLTKDQ